MLIEFKVGNFRSFKDIVTLSMVASSDKEHMETNTIKVDDKLRLLKSAVLYGANASGKSNLFKAMGFMKKFISTSSKESLSTEKIPIEKFLLSTETEKVPSTFEIVFIIDKIRYRYGFQADTERIHNEWLFFMPTIREATLFIREKDKIKLGPYFKEGKGLESKTRPNALFLSVADQFNGEISGRILKWFQDFKIISGVKEMGYTGFSISKLEDEDKEFKEFLLKFLKVADMGIKELRLVQTPINAEEFFKGMSEELRDSISSKEAKIMQLEINTVHQKFDQNNNPLSDEKFDLSDHESAGTQSLFAFSGPIYDVLKNGKVLVIDELTSKLHPLLIRSIVEIFHHYNVGKETDSISKAQLLFASHDISILTNQLFRRDQIWFTQKNECEVTDLYSLEEYRVRKDASFNKDYMLGKYGAIPFIGDIDSLF
ncbi:MAG: ATP-binding protein [Candidatus Aminicenantes bacterium]|nr:MAG: ATP-binding protein [Candidatus Aminicenantes bacterium]